ncbi:MAG TPA: serine/threonine-protein kinase [Planctomycetota bacterium]
MSLTADDSARFGFASERWLEVLRTAESPAALGRLGPYELLEEAGRGGQGVVFRARQPGTGRVIALKRLLAGAFASPQTLRRFEREVEAAVALSHPGIVTVYGVERAEGAPLLAMEWVAGAPVTRWAAGRPREEILELFLLVCEAVQHAHQRGVLHRDLKPSNVLVDAVGRPRVLDFGLAKLTSDARPTLTSSGDFLGTPAYAAPEQWRGEELDVRADVYSLGALLFEMLTGRRLIEGEGLKAVLQASAGSTPTRPSALVRSLPRELDAIVLQALSAERERRYQSVDALASDLRRFLAGEPISATPPSAGYLVRKLIARNRLTSALVALLLAATLAYAGLTARHAGQVVRERDQALLASQAEARAHLQAEAERERAELALTRAEDLRRRAERERENVEAVLAFLVDDVIEVADPEFLGHEPKLVEVLRAAVPRVPERFQHDVETETRVHAMLGQAFLTLGSYSEAEAETRTAYRLLRDSSSAEPREVAEAAWTLGRILYNTGQNAEAEALLRETASFFEATVPQDTVHLGTVLSDLLGLYLATQRHAEALEVSERVLALLTGGFDRLAARGNHAVILEALGRYDEARAELEAVLSAADEVEGLPHSYRAEWLFNLGTLQERGGEIELAGTTFRRSLASMTEAFGSDHPYSAPAMGRLARNLAERGEDLEEAERLARHALGILVRAGSDDWSVVEHRNWLGDVLMRRADHAQAAELFAQSLPSLASLFGTESPEWLSCAQRQFRALSAGGRGAEAAAVLDRIEAGAAVTGRCWALRQRAAALRDGGDLAGAAQLYEEVIALLDPLPSARANLAVALVEYAETLRLQGDAAGAEELERQATELRR